MKKHEVELNIKDIPETTLKHIRQEFEASPDVHQLYIEQQLAQRQGNYIKALEIGKKIDSLYSMVVTSLVEEAEKSMERVEINAKDFPPEKRKEMVEIIVTLFMACDILETAVMDFDDIIKSKDNTLDFDMFDDVLKLKDRARAKLDYFRTHSHLMQGLYWADQCDNMYVLLRHKAGAVLRHRADEARNENKNKTK